MLLNCSIPKALAYQLPGKEWLCAGEKSVDTLFSAVYSARLRCFGTKNNLR